MAVRIAHVDFAVPGLRHLVMAVARRRWSMLEVCLIAGGGAAALAWHRAVLGLVLILAVGLIAAAASERSRRLWRSWIAARRRRRALNGEAARQARATALHAALVDVAAAADHDWRVHIADAVVGRRQAIVNDRPAPRLDAFRRLEDVPALAASYNIALMGEGAARPPRLVVPPPERFAPDMLSPTMANMTERSLAHAREEGTARAVRRHAQAVAIAERYGPLLRFAEEAAAALAAPPPAPDYQR